MIILNTKFKGLKILKKVNIRDNRGFFSRDFCKSKLKFEISQINFSFNKKKGTLRGFHFQKKPFEEDKIITVVNGEIFNVCIDLRKESKTFLKKFCIKLSDKSNKSILVPKGFANAYLTIKNKSKILYYMSQSYRASHSSGFNYKEKKFNVLWPIKPKIISKRDRNLPLLTQ